MLLLFYPFRHMAFLHRLKALINNFFWNSHIFEIIMLSKISEPFDQCIFFLKKETRFPSTVKKASFLYDCTNLTATMHCKLHLIDKQKYKHWGHGPDVSTARSACSHHQRSLVMSWRCLLCKHRLSISTWRVSSSNWGVSCLHGWMCDHDPRRNHLWLCYDHCGCIL